MRCARIHAKYELGWVADWHGGYCEKVDLETASPGYHNRSSLREGKTGGLFVPIEIGSDHPDPIEDQIAVYHCHQGIAGVNRSAHPLREGCSIKKPINVMRSGWLQG